MKIFTLLKDAPVRILFLLILIISLVSPAQSQVRMRANLYIVDNNGATLMDGNMTNYASNYSNAVDGYDIWKMTNFGENFGILRMGSNLIIERRNLISTVDTTFLRMWNMQQRTYRIQVIAENLNSSNRLGMIKDKFLNQDILINLNDTTNLDFTVTGTPGSYMQDRFQIVIGNVEAMAGVLPITFTNLQAQRKNSQVKLTWSVGNETSVDTYVVEHSSDAVHFAGGQAVNCAKMAAGNSYNAYETEPESNTVYYRIKAMGTGEKIQYSDVVKVSASGSTEFTVYPNPVANKTMQLQFSSNTAGNMQLSLIDNNGVSHNLGIIKVTAGTFNQSVPLPENISAGIYRLQAITQQNNILVKTIIVL